MCERCGNGFSFFGLAEPQAAMLEGYASALKSGWHPVGDSGSVPVYLSAIETDAPAFLAGLADHIDGVGTAGAPRAISKVSLVRWLWDGDFCGEIRLTFDRDRSVADRVAVMCSIVAAKQGHDYAERATRQILRELPALGVALPL